MFAYLKFFISNIVLALSALIIWHDLLNKKINFRNKKVYIVLLLQALLSTFNHVIVTKFIRIIIITIIFMFLIKYLFKVSIQKTILTSIYYQLIVFISEFIVLMFINIFWDQNHVIFFLESFIGMCVINLIVSCVSIIIARFKFVKKIYNKIIISTNKINTKHLIIMCLLSMLFLNTFVVNTYYKLNIQYWIIINIFFILFLFVVMLMSLKAENKFNKVSDKYNVAIKSLNDFEEMMSKYRVVNHENKNLLLTIRAMIINKEKDIPKYIDSIIEDKYEDDEKLMFKMSIIPSGGLRATIYSSILKIKDNNIKYDLVIDKKIKTLDLIELDTNTTIDICKIIGVFIDNAIDETKKLKDGNIATSIYMSDKKLHIKISNMIKNKIEVDKIYNEGYTTKTEGHGYGLTLVRNIIDNNNLLQNTVEINKNTFSQILIINKATKKHTKY